MLLCAFPLCIKLIAMSFLYMYHCRVLFFPVWISMCKCLPAYTEIPCFLIHGCIILFLYYIYSKGGHGNMARA